MVSVIANIIFFYISFFNKSSGKIAGIGEAEKSVMLRVIM
jgi:hypothetical protein